MSFLPATASNVTCDIASTPFWPNCDLYSTQNHICMHTRPEAVQPGFECRPRYKLSSRCFIGRVIDQCVRHPLDGH